MHGLKHASKLYIAHKVVDSIYIHSAITDAILINFWQRPKLLTLCWRHADVFSEEGAPDSSGLNPPGDGLGYLFDAQVDEFTQGKSNHHYGSLSCVRAT